MTVYNCWKTFLVYTIGMSDGISRCTSQQVVRVSFHCEHRPHHISVAS